MNHGQRWRTALSRPAPSARDSGPGGTDEGALAALGLTTTWLNSPPLTAPGLSGRVVLVDFCTYTCINWLRTLPYRRAWLEKYGGYGLVLIGVHTPEFDFEHDLGNIRRALDDLGVGFPVAVDNDYDIWTAFGNHYWPALYFVDVHRRVRHHHFGEGDYEQSEAMIQRLLSEAGASGFGEDPVRVAPAGVEAAADWATLRSPENYLGSERTENFASPSGTDHGYVAPPDLPLNSWALAGDWRVTRQAVVLTQGDGVLSCRFHARDVHLVMAPATPGDRIPFQVRIDGLPPAGAQGSDVDAEGNGFLDQPRLYQLVRQAGPVTDHTFEIAFQEAGARAYAFTFG